MKSVLVGLAIVALTATPAAAQPGHGNAYHVDCASTKTPKGTVGHPLTSLDQVNALDLGPGDRVLFKRGTTCAGTLAPQGSGEAGAPIVIDTYGSGAKPHIQGGGADDAVKLHNQQQWEIRDLEVTNTGATAGKRRGVRVSARDAGTLGHIVLRGLNVHDVNGDDTKDEYGSAGITMWVEGNSVPTRFDDVQILDNTIARVDRSGVFLFSSWNRSGWGKDSPGVHVPWTGVKVNGNTVTDVGGDGIVLGSVAGALAEHNRVDGYQRRSKGYSAGLWTHNSDDVVIQFNEVSGGETTRDGMSFDVDENGFGTVFQYNHSHDNAGGFLLLCNAGGAIRNAVVRYNLSVNDHFRGVENCGGGVESAAVYNNTFVIGDGVEQTVINENNTTRRNVSFTNNIVLVQGTGKASFKLRSGGYTLADNLLYGVAAPAGATGTVTGDPLLDAAYKLGAGSPALGRGRAIEANGGRDYFGNPVTCTPDIGMHQLTPCN
ncbi:right-handed parallel beta-helix repeat-containing protein [Nonomuraea sp. NBC_01738]|uniref:right-handed parallel beta-helix repeat-containing protein n=1 Tax=Nonomuraea sp. NBC_01738 TaxID=2976003 RepID=UPI002E1169A0|nr:right-handed parallel beta-helix repeat-containing protein [Nonomuraea sp. NBC_01738]